ncbi:MAG: carboxypeptidase regulatory-like domain-containing protein, partial [Candidatus Methanoperedens sp.]|nr:carboxypeptidase regulatory-like domain-containing protein [Candidatus Methanoperedens sp.]
MNIELDSIDLNKTLYDQDGGVEEVRYISNISTSDKRGMVEHEIPGMEGNVFQNLGRSPVNISFDGAFEGKTAKSNLEVIRSKYKQGIPLPFHSDVSGATDVTKVLIEDLRVDDVAGMTNMYRYSIVLMEYKEPPPEPTTPPSQDAQAEDWAENAANETVESINCLTGKVLDSEDNPKTGIKVVARSYDGEYRGQTNDEGMYRIENLDPGKYKVTVISEEYEGVEEVVIIGKGGRVEAPPEEEVIGEPAEEETTEEPAEEETTEEPAEEETTEEPAEEETTEEPAEEETTEEPTEEETTEEPTEEETTEEPTEEETTEE